jgi:hypothetical protein
MNSMQSDTVYIRTAISSLVIGVRRVHDLVVYIDEFGQDGKPGKFALGMLFMPRPGAAVLAELMQRVVGDVLERFPRKKRVKAPDWSETHRIELCDMIRDQQWMIGADCRDLSHPGWKAPNPQREQLFDLMIRDGHYVGLQPTTVNQIHLLYDNHHAYIDEFYMRLKDVTNALADDGILIRSIEFVADDKIGAEMSKAMEFYAWVWLSRRYPHFEQPARYRVNFRLIEFRTSNEQREPNLLAADAMAHWWGMTQIDERYVPGGRAKFQAYLDRANCLKQQGRAPDIA